ncbi:uncharacterized protein PFL1_05496 [Pseudozyma flocculosa PF-1]|uniref:Related to white collar 1 protein n=2 Tax=Pseudozyma flocculosa TaxID=84751 RepID=A0A5C3F9Z8_9BASI|nr:uncharacterized protein PFL1_05496 [Pseudozyma flocculosa PF-1]EPQ26861.1 hypothetical protein PFL1_05496 [Pseudozyma flocculosa PF-1]SPO41234.1 related to white collar 1 protein [Pseudozyma flocculosa]
MSEPFDFDAFIASPSQAESTLQTQDRNASNKAALADGAGGDMLSSFSDHGFDGGAGIGNAPSYGQGLDASTAAGSNYLSQADAMMYGTFGDPMGGDIMHSWDFNTVGGVDGGSNATADANGLGNNGGVDFDSSHGVGNTHAGANAIAGVSHGGGAGGHTHASAPMAAGLDAANIATADIDPALEIRKQAAANYRNSIAAHHSQLLTSGSGARPAMPGVAPNGPLRSALTVPRVTKVKRPGLQGPHAKAVTVAAGARPGLTLQERRRMSRQMAKQAVQAAPHHSDAGAASNVNVSGRGAKRGIDTDSGLPSGGASATSMQAYPSVGSDGRSMSHPHDAARLREPSYAAPPSTGPPSAVFTGQYSTNTGDEVPTANRYSSSGIDVLGILSRAIARPNPRISLGPVDLSCSFTISDAHHPEQPLLYASETFCHLTGYSLNEIVGRNCRFLQAPNVPIERGSERQHTDNRAVEHLKRHLSTLRECQASLINYRKDGTPFINLVTVVPVSWSNPNQVDFFVGFQVDLVEQPGAILERKDDGSYVVNYRSINDPPPSAAAAAGAEDPAKDANAEANKQAAIAKDILDLIHGNGPCDAKHWSRVLLENSHDLIYVLSLKGTFLYVSPSVERILGFTADEVIGKSISEFCHPSDVVPVFRELKDSTSNASIAAAASRSLKHDGVANPMTKGGGGQAGPKVNLILRMRHKHDGHRWIESTGKLHLEQGKGRKVVISSGRPRPVYNLAWEHVRSSAELGEPSFWTKLSIDGIVLSTTGAVRDVLGCEDKALFGRHVLEVTNYEAAPSILQALRSSQSMTVSHLMGDGKANSTPVFTSFFPSSAAAGPALPTVFVHVQRAAPESSWMIPNVAYPKGGPQPAFDATGTSVDSLTSVFAELSTYRSSSWVFEMHQLKNVNRRLKDEIRALRRQSRDAGALGQQTPLVNVVGQSPSSSSLMRQNSNFAEMMQHMAPPPGVVAAPDAMSAMGSGTGAPMTVGQSPIKRRPDHGYGHRQHLRPTPHVLPYMHGSSSTERSSSSGSDFSPFPERIVQRRSGSGSGDGSDETGITTANSSGNTSEKDPGSSGSGSGSGSETRRGSTEEQ